ncbi:MAG: cupin domain-containing protein [Akkermansiaceae bacterium]
MSKEQVEDLAIQYATEGLDAEGQVIYDAWILTASDEEKQVFAEMVDVCADVSLSAVDLTKVEISRSVKADLLKKVEKSSEQDGVMLVREGDQEWINLPVKGAQLLELSARKEDGFVVSMIDVKPGSEFPAHDHHGVEMAYILEGDLESDGVMLNAGDFFRADAGTHHGKHFSPSGCRALIVTASENYHHKTMKTLGAVQKAYRKIKGVFASSNH